MLKTSAWSYRAAEQVHAAEAAKRVSHTSSKALAAPLMPGVRRLMKE